MSGTAHRKRLLPILAADVAGDSVLAVFEIATGAVSVALAIQQELDASASNALEARRMRFRIGIHLGDVIEKADGTVYGDGVNIAARLEGLAEPGGIAISESIRTAVKGKVGAEFDELGDLTRFGSARQLMAYLGLVPRESSSGEHRRQGSITKAGNSYARRALIEAAWAYRHPARVTRIIATRQTGLRKAACDIAWRAQLRLSAKYRRLNARHLNHNKIVVALARELSGFVWAIGQSVRPQ